MVLSEEFITVCCLVYSAILFSVFTNFCHKSVFILLCVYSCIVSLTYIALELKRLTHYLPKPISGYLFFNPDICFQCLHMHIDVAHVVGGVL